MLKSVCEGACGRVCVRNACESASERVRVVVRVGERLRMHVGARESAFSESAPESYWECVCESV